MNPDFHSSSALSALPVPQRGSGNCWWVNQNQTYWKEISGGFLWSPKANSNGNRNQFYDFMTEVQAGDLVFSFCDTFIKAVGIATGPATSAPKPDFDKAGGNWSNVGWLVPVEFTELSRTVRPKDHISKYGNICRKNIHRYKEMGTVSNRFIWRASRTEWLKY